MYCARPLPVLPGDCNENVSQDNRCVESGFVADVIYYHTALE